MAWGEGGKFPVLSHACRLTACKACTTPKHGQGVHLVTWPNAQDLVLSCTHPHPQALLIAALTYNMRCTCLLRAGGQAEDSGSSSGSGRQR